MMVKIDSQLSSIFSFTTDLKRIQTPHSLLRDFEQTNLTKPLQLVGQEAEFKFESKCPCQSSGDHSPLLFHEQVEDFDCEVKCRALRVALRHSSGGLEGPEKAQSVSYSDAVAAGSEEFLKRATTLVMLTFFGESKRF